MREEYPSGRTRVFENTGKKKKGDGCGTPIGPKLISPWRVQIGIRYSTVAMTIHQKRPSATPRRRVGRWMRERRSCCAHCFGSMDGEVVGSEEVGVQRDSIERTRMEEKEKEKEKNG